MPSIKCILFVGKREKILLDLAHNDTSSIVPYVHSVMPHVR